MKYLVILLSCLFAATAQAADTFVSFAPQTGYVQVPTGRIVADSTDYPGVLRAVRSLQADMQAVCGHELQVTIGSIDRSTTIQKLAKNKVIDAKQLKGKTEKFLIYVGDNNGQANQIIVAGSDKRGTMYGIYELSRQLGVSPWYWWADMPIEKHADVYAKIGQYTDGEPVVRYRGIFLNDEAPCLSNWVNEKFPDAACPSANPKLAKGFNHHFYEKVFELLLRLKANYMWPAMWGNAFYADDSLNSVVADEMGIIMGTSHHEPMARNHQEWARHRKENGPWDYATNQKVIDQFFREGIRRARNTEDLITIGMRGDGDAAMGGKEGHDDEFVSQDDYYIKLYEKIFRNQRQIIKEETGKDASKRPQLWALYKEVQHYYDLGLNVPDDVIILLCDDNWGNIRRIPTQYKSAKGNELKYGMYYHVDYVGAPRNTKWTNVTPIAHLWEQMRLCVDYKIDDLWILNVGDLKPMEYPIDFFLEMAWDPAKFESPNTIREHTLRFTTNMVGEAEAAEAAHIMEQYGIYNGRVTPEMLNARTYNLESGEWAKVVADYQLLEVQAQHQFERLPEPSRDSYQQLVLFPVQCMSNLYEMYYHLAMGNQKGVDICFDRDSVLCATYHQIGGGKWNHLMREPHIGYRSWNGPHKNIRPVVDSTKLKPQPYVIKGEGGHTFVADKQQVVIEAEHYYSLTNPSAAGQQAKWTIIPAMGRTLSAIEVLPHNADLTDASITYRMQIADSQISNGQAEIHVITNSTLPFKRKEGHRYLVKLDNADAVEVNYNSDCTEENQWHMYDVVATRIIETVTKLPIKQTADGIHTLTITPIDPGMCLEKIVVDLGGYKREHLFGTESQTMK